MNDPSIIDSIWNQLSVTNV